VQPKCCTVSTPSVICACQDFLDISNPKAVLETTLRGYACLTKGDCICLHYNNKRYYIDIIEAKPEVCLHALYVPWPLWRFFNIPRVFWIACMGGRQIMPQRSLCTAVVSAPVGQCSDKQPLMLLTGTDSPFGQHSHA
jgi:hypothetical protein